MPALLLFSLLLVAAVLISARAERSVLSTTVVFLVGGMAAGRIGFGVTDTPAGNVVELTAEVALFAVLLTDGMHLSARDLAGSWNLPVRALGIGLPVTLAIEAVAGHLLLGLGWPAALLLAAVLAPTDPVLAEAIVGRRTIPLAVRRTLNVESGINDGLVLPLVVVLLSLAPTSHPHPSESQWSVPVSLVGGLAIGVVVPAVLTWLQGRPFLGHSARYGPILVITIGFVVFAACEATGANLFLAAFAAGITLATVDRPRAHEFERIGGVMTELLKVGAVFLLGLSLPADLLATTTFALGAFVVVTLVLSRPVGIVLALVGSPLNRAQRGAIAWFGPKGFASVTFSLLVVHQGIEAGETIFHAAAAVIVVSMLVHSSTDVVVARRLAEVEVDAEAETETETEPWGHRVSGREPPTD